MFTPLNSSDYLTGAKHTDITARQVGDSESLAGGYRLKATEETWSKGTSELVHILHVCSMIPICRDHRIAVSLSDTPEEPSS